MTSQKSPFAPDQFPIVHPVKGVKLGGIEVGIRYKDRPDLFLAELCEGTTIAGVLTTSSTCSAAVNICKKHLKQGHARAIIVNAGNANTFTGDKEKTSATAIVEATANILECPVDNVFHASTGVIGEPLAHERIIEKIAPLHDAIDENSWQEAAHAILTTDTFAKAASVQTEIDGKTITISGFTKGSGMIAPNMATMLGFIFTDAKIPATLLQEMLTDINQKTFNSITVDSDTSTSDTVLLCATGQVPHKEVLGINDTHMQAFKTALFNLMKDLAHQIVKDGEGASKFITINVKGATSNQSAHIIALSIANSPLVKTALAASDANWGRVVAAVGKSGEPVDRNKLSVGFGGITIAQEGQLKDDFDETPVAKHLQNREINIDVDLNLSDGSATVWTCDLTHGYIDINASYRS